VDIQAFVIGPDRDFQDLYGDWAMQSEIGEAGCVLVRPDGYICFRHATKSTMAVELLSNAMAQILGSKDSVK
jgi:2,4-dichlorophenol 6-monooxygenase